MPKQLIQLLKEFEKNSFKPIYDQEDQRLIDTTHSDALLDTIIDKAECVLIDGVGKPNFDNIKILSDAGFKVTAGEQDSFGWLTGLIYTKKGKILFG